MKKRINKVDADVLLTNELHKNEVATNKAVALSSLIFVILPITNQLLLAVEYSIGMSMANRYLFLPTALLILLTDAVAIKFEFDKPWIKHMLLGTFILMTTELYFVYTTCTLYFVILPIFIATRYFDKRLIKRVALIIFLSFMISSVLNNVLISFSPLIRFFHRNSSYDFWSNPIDVIVYVLIPFLIVNLFISNYAVTLTRSGYHLIRIHAENNRQIAKVNAELNMAAEFQKSVLPDTAFITSDGNFRISAFERTAREVGGDFYDYFMIDENTLVFLIADVSDKGVPAALFMMSAKKIINTLMRINRDLEETADLINQIICEDNTSGMFLTLWLGVIDTRTGYGKYINAGHLPPIIKHADGRISLIENEPDLFIGTFPDHSPTVHPFNLCKGDTLLLYTDGITDAVNEKGESFGWDRLICAIESADAVRDNLVSYIEETLQNFEENAEQFDDETILALRCINTEKKLENCFSAPAVTQGTEQMINHIEVFLKELNCPDEIRRATEMMVDEICCNICEYAYPERDGKMRIEAEGCSNAVILKFFDQGIAFNPLEIPEPVFTEEPKYGGLGIYLVKQQADELEYAYINGENCLTLKKVWNI